MPEKPITASAMQSGLLFPVGVDSAGAVVHDCRMNNKDNTDIWRIIPSFPDYEVSSLGKVRRLTPRKDGKPNLLLTPQGQKRGQYTTWIVGLFPQGTKPGYCVRRTISRLVCEAFHGAPPSIEHHAAHRDGNPGNNAQENIYWAMPKENIYDQMRHGTFATRESGRKKGCCTVREVNAMLFLYSQKVSATILAKAFGLRRTSVHQILKKADPGYLDR